MNGRIGGALCLWVSLGIFAPNLESQELPAKQRAAPVKPVTVDYFGTKVVDDYR